MTEASPAAKDHVNARRVREVLLGTGSGKGLDAAVLEKLKLLREPSTPLPEWLDAAAVVADFSLGYLTPEDLQGVWIDPVWVGDRAADPKVAALLSAYAAASRRDAAAMSTTGLAGLKALPQGVAPNLMRDHLLVIAMLGAVGEGDLARVRKLEDAHGASVKVSNNFYGLARAYLSAWAAANAKAG